MSVGKETIANDNVILKLQKLPEMYFDVCQACIEKNTVRAIRIALKKCVNSSDEQTQYITFKS